MARFRASLLLLLPLGLTACGGGGGGSSSAPAGDVGNYSPLAVGNRWLYESTYEPSLAGPSILTEVRTATLTDGRDALLMRSDYLTTPASRMESHLQKRPDGLYQLLPPMERILPGVDELPLLRFPLRAGDRYTAFRYDNLNVGVDLDDDGINERISHRLDVDVNGTESVTVAAGTFADAIKVVTTRHASGRYSQGYTWSVVSEVTSWYAPGFGVVKIRTVTSDNGAPAQVTVLNLASYRVDGIPSETVAPTVQSVSPAPDSTVSYGFGIGVTFSEEMDPATVSSTALTLRDAGGNEIPGSVVYGARTLSFVPDYVLPEGTYSATLSTGITDALGTPLAAPYTWNFTRTASAPVCYGNSAFC